MLNEETQRTWSKISLKGVSPPHTLVLWCSSPLHIHHCPPSRGTLAAHYSVYSSARSSRASRHTSAMCSRAGSRLLPSHVSS